MPDEELINELQTKAKELGADFRWLIDELIKRFKIAKFNQQIKMGRTIEHESRR